MTFNVLRPKISVLSFALLSLNTHAFSNVNSINLLLNNSSYPLVTMPNVPTLYPVFKPSFSVINSSNSGDVNGGDVFNEGGTIQNSESSNQAGSAGTTASGSVTGPTGADSNTTAIYSGSAGTAFGGMVSNQTADGSITNQGANTAGNGGSSSSGNVSINSTQAKHLTDIHSGSSANADGGSINNSSSGTITNHASNSQASNSSGIGGTSASGSVTINQLNTSDALYIRSGNSGTANGGSIFNNSNLGMIDNNQSDSAQNGGSTSTGAVEISSSSGTTLTLSVGHAGSVNGGSISNTSQSGTISNTGGEQAGNGGNSHSGSITITNSQYNTININLNSGAQANGGSISNKAQQSISNDSGALSAGLGGIAGNGTDVNLIDVAVTNLNFFGLNDGGSALGGSISNSSTASINNTGPGTMNAGNGGVAGNAGFVSLRTNLVSLATFIGASGGDATGGSNINSSTTQIDNLGATITAGNGGNAGRGGSLNIYNSLVITNEILGGHGGSANGGNVSNQVIAGNLNNNTANAAGAGGQAGAGGHGSTLNVINNSIEFNISQNSRVVGGMGGHANGGNVTNNSSDSITNQTQSNAGGDGGTAGNGGSGIVVQGEPTLVDTDITNFAPVSNQVYIFNHGLIQGADGGNANGGSIYNEASNSINNNNSNLGGNGGTAGSGGKGVDFRQSTASSNILYNTGIIRGGNSGNAQGGGISNNATNVSNSNGSNLGGIGGTISDSGEAVIGSNITLINSGTLAGGTDANAITFTGGSNRLELHSGSVIIGNVVINQPGNNTNVLALGGTKNGTFNASTIGSTAQYQNFSTFEKTGSSIWELTGSTTALNNWSVNAGTLLVNATITGAMQVYNNGILGGNGKVGTTIVQGTITPGNSIGTLTIQGNYTQSPGSFYNAEVDSSGQSDLINITGAATINGGTVRILNAASNYTPGARYTILTAAGGRTGAYANSEFPDQYPFLRSFLNYDAEHVFLDIERSGLSFSTFALTRNQQSTADALARLNPNSLLFASILNLPNVPVIQQAYNTLSGEAFVSTLAAWVDESRYVRQAIWNRLSTLNTLASEKNSQHDYQIQCTSKRCGVWAQGFGSWGQINGSRNTGTLDRNISGFFVAADATPNDASTIGILSGYTNSDYGVPSRYSKLETNSYYLGAYAGTRNQQWRFNIGGAYAWQNNTSHRLLQYTQSSLEHASTKYNGGTGQVFIEAAYLVAPYHLSQLKTLAIEPFVNLAYVNTSTNHWYEKNSIAGLDGSAQYDNTLSQLGIREQSLMFAYKKFNLSQKLMLGWQHAYQTLSPHAYLSFISGSIPFSIHGNTIARDSLVIDAGILGHQQRYNNLELKLSYLGLVSSSIQDHGLLGTISWKFS